MSTRIPFFIFLLTLLTLAKNSSAQPAPPKLSTFAILYEPGPAWLKDKPISDQPLAEHTQYMQKLLDANILILAGPFADSSGSMAIVRAPNWKAAEHILTNDPAVKSKLFTATLRPWQIALAAEDVPLHMPELPITKMQIGSQTFTLEVAAGRAELERGLMYRDSLPEHRGMIFVFAEEQPLSFWMKNTAIPLDLIFLDSAGKVVSIHSLKPFDLTSVPSDAPARYAIELNPGSAAAAGIKKGDLLPIPPDIQKLPVQKLPPSPPFP